MASYPRITPATQANFSPVIDDPADTESANKLAQVDLQTRRFVSDYLATKFDATTEKLLPAAVDAATTLVGLVSGSTSNAGTQQQVVQGTVSTPDLRDSAISTGKIADQAVTAAKIADGTVGTTELAALAVTAAKIANGTITSTQLAANAVVTASITDANVTTSKIAALAVTAAKIAANTITGGQLVAGAAEGDLLIAGVSPFNFAVKTMSGGATIDKNGVVTLTQQGTVEVEERANSTGTVGGAASAASWNDRGNTVGWVKTFDTLGSSFLTTPSTSKLALVAGTYIIEASAPAYNVGIHRLRIGRYNSSNVNEEYVYGTSEVAPATIQSRAVARVKMTFAAGDYFKVEHYLTSNNSTSDMGTPSSQGTYEIYARVSITRVS